LDSVFLCNSGTESVEGALKFAKCATGRPRIVSLKNSYHGLTHGALSVTGNPYFQEGFSPLVPGAVFVALGDLDALEAELRQNDVAALIVELVQGKGVKFPKDDYFNRAQALCRKYGTLLICDEVQTGLGRTGRWFAFEHWNLEPDIITLAKGLSAGYVPCAAIITRRAIYQKTFSRLDRCIVHSTTFGRNNLACACGLAALTVLEDEKLIENAAVMGAELEKELLNLKAKHEIISDVRVKGLMCAIEFAEPGSLMQKMGWKAIHALDSSLFPQLIVTPLLSQHRIITQVAANNADVVKILPPLMIGAREVARFIVALDEVLESLKKFPGPIWEMGQNFFKAARSGAPKSSEPATV
jgi:ornithine--oxo-acid transaminase